MEAPEGEIRWPPDGDFELNVTGFRDACRGALTVLVNDVLPVPVVSPEGLVVLKLFAWHDRHLTQPRKDAADLAYVLRYYGEVLGQEVLFDG